MQAETINTITIIFSGKSRLHAKIWVLNWFEPIKKTDFSPAENIDVVGKYLKINSVTIQFFWSIRLKKKTRMKLSARRVPRECFDFWMFLDVLWHWVASNSGLPLILLSDETVSDKAQLSVSQQTDLLLIIGAKDCRASWIANNSLQVEFYFISDTLKFLKHILSVL